MAECGRTFSECAMLFDVQPGLLTPTLLLSKCGSRMKKGTTSFAVATA